MAARINKPYHAEKTKRLIRASQLLNRLTAFANGKAELSRAQVAAAAIVINKEIPDVTRSEHTGADGAPLLTGITVSFVGTNSAVP